MTIRPHSAHGLREASAVADLFVGVFRRDLLNFFPQAVLDTLPDDANGWDHRDGPGFRIQVGGPTEVEAEVEVAIFGACYRLSSRDGAPFSTQDRRLVDAIGAVLSLRYHHLFQAQSAARLELFRGGSEDHYVAAFVEPRAYDPSSPRASRVASTIQTLRTAALSTYENHRVSTGALLLGPGEAPRLAPPDALPYGVELTGLKSIHRLCDGERTLFLVDRAGKLAEIVDVARWADEADAREGGNEGADGAVPCARSFEAHARATRRGGHLCLVLSRNQEIKLFAGGAQAFAFAHGRWRMLDPAAKYASWRRAVADEAMARGLFQAALNLSEGRRGGLFVVVDEPEAAVGRLVAPHDVVAESPPEGPPPVFSPHDPLARRALHYLARGRSVAQLDPSVLEALASLDGALVADRDGRLLAFGAILRHDASDLPALLAAEGARTSAALVASRFGPVLKVSEDGIVSCYLQGARAWDL